MDYYRVPELSSLDPQRVVDLALAALGRASMPLPALAYLFRPRPLPPVAALLDPRAALPRWTACQHELYDERFEAPRLDQEVIG